MLGACVFFSPLLIQESGERLRNVFSRRETFPRPSLNSRAELGNGKEFLNCAIMRAPDLDLIYERFSDTYQPAASELGGMEKQVDSELPVLLVFPFLFLSLSLPPSLLLSIYLVSLFLRE